MRTASTLFALYALVAFCAPASANLSIDKLWVEFEEGRQERNDLVIRNDSDDRYYVSVSVTEISSPGTDDETKATDIDPESLGLLVTPNRLVLEPGAIRSIRLVSLNTGLTKDRIYRVLVSPQVGAIKAEGDTSDNRGIAIKLLAAYDVLVVDRPRERSIDLSAQRNGDTLNLINEGNTNVLVSEGYVCPPIVGEAPDVELCQKIEARRLYTGNVMPIQLTGASDRVFIRTKSGPLADMVERIF